MNTKIRFGNRRYIRGFDGIRTIAVIGVILYHLFPNIVRGGYLGVPIFFAISGYLITDLLRQEWDENGSIDIKGFYIRRMKRLYPGLLAMLLMACTYILFFQKDLLNNLRSIFFSSVLYYNNWWQIFRGFSYFDRFAIQSPFTHIWSLAVEAQNYLIWPLIFVTLIKYVKHSKRIFVIIFGVALCSALLMAVLYTPGSDPSRVYYGTDTRLFSILFGSSLAFVWPSWRLKAEVPLKEKRMLNSLGITSLVVLGIAFFILSDQMPIVYYGGMLIVSLFSTLLVAVTAHPGSNIDSWLSNSIFDWIGKRSYGIYLYQFPVMIFYEAKISNLSDNLLLHSFIELVLILAISELSYRFIEKPLSKFYYEYTWLAIKDIFKRPIVTVPKISAILGIMFACISTVALVISPSNQMTAEQQELKTSIEENKKKAEQRKEEEKNGNTTDVSDQEVIQGTDTNFGLSEKELKKAQTMEITAFGDSVILDAGVGLQEIFPKLLVDGEVGRQLYSSISVVDELKKDNLLKQTILVGLGTNGSFTEAQFAEFMSAIGSDKKVYWINVRVPTRRWQNEVNTMLNEMKKNYKNLTIIDWYSYSNEHEEWFYDDRVHPNVDGQVQYASFIAKQLLK